MDVEERNRHLLEVDKRLEVLHALNDGDDAYENMVMVADENNRDAVEEIMNECQPVG